MSLHPYMYHLFSLPPVWEWFWQFFDNCFWHFPRELCPNGTYSLGGQIECTPCYPGFACAKKTEGPQKCVFGHYSEKNSANCSVCKAGYQCSDPAGTVNDYRDKQYSVNNLFCWEVANRKRLYNFERGGLCQVAVVIKCISFCHSNLP